MRPQSPQIAVGNRANIDGEVERNDCRKQKVPLQPNSATGAQKSTPEVPPDNIDEAVKQLAAKRSAVVVRPQKIASWDHRKLGGTY